MFTINDRLLADYVEKEQSNNGKFYFKSAEILQFRTAMRVLDRLSDAGHYAIDILDSSHSLPYWLHICIAAALAPKAVALLVPNYNQPVFIPNSTIPQGIGSGPITFSTMENEEFTLVQFASPRNLQPDQGVPPIRHEHQFLSRS